MERRLSRLELLAGAPYRFCREIIELIGHERLGLQYMEVVLGFKPLLDDWVPKRHLNRYIAACRRYGLHVLPDIQFATLSRDQVPLQVIGRERLTSTVAYGIPVKADFSGSVHVYVSRKPGLLRRGMWYPLIIRGRVLSTPWRRYDR